MPFYKGESHLESWLAALADNLDLVQAKMNFELIMVIDSPLDSDTCWIKKTANEALASYPCEVHVAINNQNYGVAHSRNHGLSNARYSHVLFLDQDDRLMPAYLSYIAPILKGYDFIICNGYLRYNYKAKTLIYYTEPKLSLPALLKDDHLRTPGQAVIRRCLLSSDGFPVPRQYAGSDDRYLWLKLFRKQPNMRIRYIRQPLLEVNVHHDNFSHNLAVMYRSCLEYWDSFDREAFAPEYAGLIRDDIHRLEGQYAKTQGKSRSLRQKWLYLRYKFTVNKIIRYIIKIWVKITFSLVHSSTNDLHRVR